MMATTSQQFNCFPDLIDNVGLDTFCRLIQDEHLGFGEQGSTDGEFLLLTAREHAAFAREKLLENGKEGEAPLKSPLGFLSLRHSAHKEIFLHSQMRKDAAALGNVSDTGARACFRRQS